MANHYNVFDCSSSYMSVNGSVRVHTRHLCCCIAFTVDNTLKQRARFESLMWIVDKRVNICSSLATQFNRLTFVRLIEYVLLNNNQVRIFFPMNILKNAHSACIKFESYFVVFAFSIPNWFLWAYQNDWHLNCHLIWRLNVRRDALCKLSALFFFTLEQIRFQSVLQTSNRQLTNNNKQMINTFSADISHLMSTSIQIHERLYDDSCIQWSA